MASYVANNPIRTVAPYNVNTSTAGTAVYVPVPSKYQYNLNDISDSAAGRTEDTLMHKNRIGQKVTINLEWWNRNTAETSEVLTAFNSEYLLINYLDGKLGTYTQKVFYVGDRSAPLYNATMGIWDNITFNIIER